MTQYDAKVDVPVAFPPQSLAMILGEVLSEARRLAAPHRRDREVRARHLLLQRRRRAAVPGRGAPAGPVEPETSRPTTSRPRCRRRRSPTAWSRRSSPAGRLHPGQLRQPRHGRPHGHAEAGDQRDRDDRRLHRPDRRRGRRPSGRRCSSPPITATARRWSIPMTGQPHTAHTTNPIPFIAIGQRICRAEVPAGGRLADVAPTLARRT